MSGIDGLLVDADTLARLNGRSLYLGVNGYVYFSTWTDGPQTLHAFAMGGAQPGLHIDHIDGNKLDNRRANLRFVTPQINQVNRKRLSRANTSGVRGVIHRAGTRNPWIAQITVNRQNLYLGSFPTVEAATAARRSAELCHYGEECPR
jgi:hypothetical protein